MAIQSDFLIALHQIASERGIDTNQVIDAVNEALVAAYRKDYDQNEEDKIEAKIDDESGNFVILVNGKESTPKDFGRIASQTAKQVILQKVSEVERETLLTQIEKRMGTLEMGTVQRFDGQNVIVEVGKISAIMPQQDQIYGEILRPGTKIKVYLKEIEEYPTGGRRLVVSRASESFIKALFENEVPEISNGTVEIKEIAREPGSRTKVAVYSDAQGIDPIGACVGQRGMRIIAMTNELGNEKIDIILWSPNDEIFIKNSLSPSKPLELKLDNEERHAIVKVPNDQLSLAIGKDGQNVRLAAKLTGWKIDIEPETPEDTSLAESSDQNSEVSVGEESKEEEKEKQEVQPL
jgi:N utilization substance protein A